METRQITQVKAYFLALNPIRSNFEKTNLVAISYDKQKLIDWYDSLKVEEYKEENWNKTFKKGSVLEMYNPIAYNGMDDIFENWITEEYISQFINDAQNSFGFTTVPELIN